MHDVRMVSDCLYWKYGIRPTNIFDTQVRLARFLCLYLYILCLTLAGIPVNLIPLVEVNVVCSQ